MIKNDRLDIGYIGAGRNTQHASKVVRNMTEHLPEQPERASEQTEQPSSKYEGFKKTLGEWMPYIQGVLSTVLIFVGVMVAFIVGRQSTIQELQLMESSICPAYALGQVEIDGATIRIKNPTRPVLVEYDNLSFNRSLIQTAMP